MNTITKIEKVKTDNGVITKVYTNRALYKIQTIAKGKRQVIACKADIWGKTDLPYFTNGKTVFVGKKPLKEIQENIDNSEI